MADPPASSASERYRSRSMDPLALSPGVLASKKDSIVRGTTEDHRLVVVETAPSGNTEISLHRSSSEPFDEFTADRADSPNKDDDDEDLENFGTPLQHWVPPADLSSLRLSICDITSPEMPRRNRTNSASSGASGGSLGSSTGGPPTPLMDNKHHGNHSMTSPTLKLPLPPSSASRSSIAASNSSSSGENGNSISKQPSASRKAQRYSSLKKQRKSSGGPNMLLNRLFCNSPMALGKNKSSEELNDDANFSANSGSSEENIHPRERKTRVQELVQNFHNQQQQQQVDSSCGRSLFQLAEENLTLHDEDKVRQNVQSSLSDTLLAACSDSPNKKSFAEDSTSILESGSLTEKKKSVTLVGDAAVGSTGKKWSKSGDGSSKKTSSSKKKTILDDGSIQEPRTRISMFDDDDDIAETASQPISGDDASSSDHQPPVTEIVRKSSTHSKRSNSSSKTPPTTKQSASGKPMKTPGGLVIPSPFTFSGRSIFPSTLGNCYPSTAADTSPPTTAITTAVVPAPAAAPARPPSRKTPSRQWPPPQLNSEAPVSSSSIDDGEERMEAEIEIQPQKGSSSPVPLFRITSSLEDLHTVHEASTSKETATMASARSKSDGGDDEDDAAFLPNGVSSLDGETDQQRAGSCNIKKSAVTKIGASTSSVASSDSTTGSEEGDGQRKSEFRALKAKYERKISEQQDQAAMANRLARMRLDEIEKLEGQMDLMKDQQVDEQHQLREQLERSQREKKEAVERVRKAMEVQMQEKLEQTEAAAKATLEKELADAKRQLTTDAATKQSKSSSPTPSHHKGQQSELQRVKLELAEVTAKLQAKEKETARSKSPVKGGNTDTLYRVTKELAEVKEQLAAKEKEMNEASTDKQKKTEAELARVKQELADVKELLLESGKAAAAAEAAAPTVSSETEDELKRVKAALSELTQKMVEKEKEQEDSKKNMLPPCPSPGLDERESLRQKVALLDEQAAKSKQEHDQVLADLRADSEKELMLVKLAMEHQSQQHQSKELELEEALSELRSQETREKEDLLRQIEQLQAEKNTEHAKEVQQNQELLERIAALEKKEKEILEDHQRSVDNLRAQGDSETQKLRKQLEEVRGVCETHSTEKEALQAEIEALESRIASESNGGALADATLERLEHDVKTAKKKHREEMIALKAKSDSEIEELKTKSDAEIKHLKEELEDRMAIEEAMQIATNESDAMKEEVQKLKIQLDEGKTLHLQNLADLRKQLADITAAHEKAVEKNGLLEQELKDHSAEAEQHAERRCKEVREACDKEIEAFKKLQAEDESKFKALLAESTAKLDAIQTQCDKKIAQLQTEIREKDEQFAQKLTEAEQHAEGDKKLQEEYEKLKTDHAKLERRMKEAESNHNNQYEELLSQLDLVEADHQEALTVKQKALSEKEAIVDALGSQLADSQKKMSATEQRLICQMEDTEHEQRKRKSLEKELESVNQEVVTLRETHKKFAKDASRQKQLACERAREEMIEKAESQFKQANEHYVKLRKQYDESQERAKKFEGELRIAKRKAEKLIKEKESCEIDLNAELAKLKAANAKIEADAALKTQEYRRELERLLQTAKDFESKAEKSERTSRNIQTTLATVVAEKEQLQKEYSEMKTVSEELMGIIESHQDGDRENQHEF